MVGENFPLDTERGYHVLFETNQQLINRPIAWSESGFYLIQIEEGQRGVLKKVFATLDKEGVANDINGYPKAPPSIRIWGGSTVQNSDVKALLPWIDWAYNTVKQNA